MVAIPDPETEKMRRMPALWSVSATRAPPSMVVICSLPPFIERSWPKFMLSKIKLYEINMLAI
jgi:hypothetical protein